MIDMKMGEKERKDLVVPDAPAYPYGLKITLGHEELEKLGLSEALQVGDEKKLYALAEVVEVSVEEEKGDAREHRVTLQIKELECIKEKKEEEKSTSQVMYGV